MSEETYRFMLRIPTSLRDSLLAVKGGRSLNREIEVRLQHSFDITVPDITEGEKVTAKRVGDAYRVRPTDYLVHEEALGEAGSVTRSGDSGGSLNEALVTPPVSPSVSHVIEDIDLDSTVVSAVMDSPNGPAKIVKRPRTKPCVHRISPEAFCARCDLT